MANNLTICPVLPMAEWVPGFNDGPNHSTPCIDRNVLDEVVIGLTQGPKRPTENIVLIEEVVPLERWSGRTYCFYFLVAGYEDWNIAASSVETLQASHSSEVVFR